jgi:hypothetical protein
MEIREICDVDGNVLSTDILNITRTMERLGNMTSLEGVDDDDGNGGGGGKRLGDILAKTLREAVAFEGGGDPSIGAGEREDDDDENRIATAVVASAADDVYDAPRRRTKEEKEDAIIGESDYEILRARLEELERMEEMEEEGKVPKARDMNDSNIKKSRMKNGNKGSMKSSQGGGWTRGFLMNTPKKMDGGGKKEEDKKTISSPSSRQRERAGVGNGNENEKAIDELPTSIPCGIGQASMNGSNLESHPSTAAGRESRATTTNAKATRTTRVSFSGDDAIREIPRIGTSRVPPRPTAASRHDRIGVTATTTTATHVTSNSVGTVVMGGGDDHAAIAVDPTTVTPFDDSVIRMVVKERINDDTTTNAAGEGGDGRIVDGRRRLSRFAQQRLQRESTS